MQIWSGSGCTDKVFCVLQVCDKYVANEKAVFWAFVKYSLSGRIGKVVDLHAEGCKI